MRYHLAPTGIKAWQASDDRIRALLIRRIRRVRNRLERTLRQRIAEELRSQMEDVLAAGTDEERDAAILAHQHRMGRIIMASYRQLYPLIAALVAPDGVLKAREASWEAKDARGDELDARIEQWMEAQLGVQIREISSSTLTEVRRLAVQADGDPEALRHLLEDSGVFSDVRARRIAVTEMTSGINHCQREAAELYSSPGDELVKTWRTTGMLNVRGTHRRMDGVTIPAEDLFRVPSPTGGEDLMEYPGDSTHGASAANIVNCHCIVFYTRGGSERAPRGI